MKHRRQRGVAPMSLQTAQGAASSFTSTRHGATRREPTARRNRALSRRITLLDRKSTPKAAFITTLDGIMTTRPADSSAPILLCRIPTIRRISIAIAMSSTARRIMSTRAAMIGTFLAPSSAAWEASSRLSRPVHISPRFPRRSKTTLSRRRRLITLTCAAAGRVEGIIRTS